MVAVDQGIAQVVILIGELNGWLIKHDALSHPVAFGEGAGGDVPNDDFQGDNGHLFYHSLPVVQLLHQVSGNAVLFQHTHEEVAHAVVDGALAGNGSFFETIEGSGVVFIGYDELFGIFCGIDLLSLAFVELLFLFHLCKSSLQVKFVFHGLVLFQDLFPVRGPPGCQLVREGGLFHGQNLDRQNGGVGCAIDGYRSHRNP